MSTVLRRRVNIYADVNGNIKYRTLQKNKKLFPLPPSFVLFCFVFLRGWLFTD